MASQAARNIAQVAYDAGFRGKHLENMIAVALAESGGNPNALNPNAATGDYSVGYWQINYHGSLRQDRTKKWGPPEALRGTDPVGPEAKANAKAAYELSAGGQNLRPWSVVGNGRYYAHLDEAKQAASEFLGGPITPGSVGSPPGVIPEMLADTIPASTMTEVSEGCLIKFPGIAGFGEICFLSHSQARQFAGVLIMVGGVAIATVGVILVVGKQSVITNAVSAVPGPWGAVAGAVRSVGPKAREERWLERQAANVDTEGQRKRARKAFQGVNRPGTELRSGDEPF